MWACGRQTDECPDSVYKLVARLARPAYPDVAKLADASDLGSDPQGCGFESLHPDHSGKTRNYSPVISINIAGVSILSWAFVEETTINKYPPSIKWSKSEVKVLCQGGW